ncbi:MAG: hypothetical protein ABIN01_23010 [Ferruginibacter sp.]
MILNWGCSNSNEAAAVPGRQLPAQLIDTINAGSHDTTILPINGEAFIKGHINAKDKIQPNYTLPVWKDQMITAIITPAAKKGNVRINKLQKPDGTFDGPFGDTLRYTADKNGIIQFIIGQKLKAGDPYTGEFLLHVTVK